MDIILGEIANHLIWQVPSWSEDGIVHGFLGADLDFGDPVQEAGIEKWQLLFSESSSAVSKELYLLKQVHGVGVVSVKADLLPPGKTPEGDAWVGIGRASHPSALGILAADCTPVLICDRGASVVGAAHCGWRGAASGLLPELVREMTLHGAELSRLEVAIGPAARACCYEVQEDVARQFQSAKVGGLRVGEGPDSGIYLKARGGRLYLDVGRFLVAQAHNLGIPHGQIALDERLCTVCDRRFFSYRRNPQASARQLSFIGLFS